ncbi:pectate lyase superfamily protein-domain-containing protein [Podospora appendiculata]|uniref:Pectate lyase superfamily protein-domain-containing protein n=1 Tax=Podospora appendiculata TaxID=314037 RepID=A0AAE0X0J6_9PEZI|nr:pectate lyase superfamily protein-domain-containing protein [Podospora appendiculata]
MGLSTICTFFLLASSLLSTTVAVPAPRAATSYWLSSIKRQGTIAFGNDTSYQVFRDVQAYGAKGDGSTDDTDAINKAISDGNRCGHGCPSDTNTPALVYFPPGTYLVSKPLVQLYYTQFVGDALNPPTLKAAAAFEGMAVIDSDPYDNTGTNFWVNQNNFFRQVRNFVIDLTAMPLEKGAGIHWQVAQATSLQNIVFNLRTDGGAANKQLGIFMDNGSGGFMSDLTFNGGSIGAFLGSQQFTTRNLTFNGCQTAIFMNWNWAWSFQDVKINNCGVGIDMSNGGAQSQTVGSVLLTDSVFTNTPIGIKTAYDPTSPQTNGTLVLDNVDMTGTQSAVFNNATQQVILPGAQKVGFFTQGRNYGGEVGAAGKAVQAAQGAAITKPQSLIDSKTGFVFTRSKPQYENVPAASFVSVKDNGAKGDGVTDDTAAIQAIFDKATADQIVYFDHGAYLVTDTVKVPKNIKITGEIWPVIMAGGDSAFKDQANPKPVFQVGQPGDTGAVEMSDLIFGTAGPQPGAIMMEWNVAGDAQGATALWDVHTRIGGYAGTNLQLEQCAKNPNVTNPVKPECFGSFLMLHVPTTGSVYLENTWFWVADHDLAPTADNKQIDVFNGRGVLIESQGPVWGWGTASEHSVLYNYQFSNASDIYLSLIQTETPYFQGNPEATTPYTVNAKFNDPDFAVSCKGNSTGCARSWGLRAVNSKDVFVYGAGLYSFFDNYDQTCLETESCQTNMVSLEQSQVHIFGLSTKASVNMLTVDGASVALDADNRNNFCATLALFTPSGKRVVRY